MTALQTLVDQGFAQLQRRQPGQARLRFEQVLRVEPDRPDALVGIMSALLHLGMPAAALPFCERALRLRPAVAEVHASCAAVYLALKRPQEGLACAENALRVRQDLFQAHYNRAEALLALNRPDLALRAYDRTLALQPRFLAAHCGRGHACREMDERQAAADSYRHALSIEPNHAPSRVGLLLATLPALPGQNGQIERSRQAFQDELSRFEAWLATCTSLSEPAIVSQPFYLAYQEQLNKELLQRWGAACAAPMERWFAQHSRGRASGSAATSAWASRSAPIGPRKNGRVRLGIVTAHLREHSVYRALIRGWLEQLDRSRLEISVFHLGAAQGLGSIAARAGAELIECAHRSLAECVQVIRSRAIDVLLYPDIGLHAETVQLASLRLAHHQLVAWGHPETSGLPTMDYYLSAEAFEPPEADQYYSERLLRLPGIGCYYEPLGHQGSDVDPVAPDIEPDVPLLLCAGTPYKYAAEHDRVLVDIARRLSRCRFIFFEAKSRVLSAKLFARLQNAFRAAGLDPAHYLLIVPWLPPDRFFALMRRAQVYLDTIGFSGFNTVMQAAECELPIVAYEGRFMRGRFASGVLRALQLDELVAKNVEEYVRLAVRLASEPEFRHSVRVRLRSGIQHLYRDHRAVDALTDFITGLCPVSPTERV